MVELIKLSYEYDALEPVIDKETMEIHHSRHHNAYVTNFNAAVKGTEFDNKDLQDIICNLEQLPENIKGAVRNNGGGVINHNLFFTSLVANGKELPEGNLNKKIVSTFGSMENLISELQEKGMKQFGSGWSWLCVKDSELVVTSTANQDNPLSNGCTPLLGIDVWEHAYYLNYQNKRPSYLEEIFKVINWEVVNERYNSL